MKCCGLAALSSRFLIVDLRALYLLISGFHSALLQSITFISRLIAFNYTKIRG